MKVKELSEILKSLHPEAEIVIEGISKDGEKNGEIFSFDEIKIEVPARVYRGSGTPNDVIFTSQKKLELKRKKNLKTIETHVLVDELKKRTGVKVENAEPYEERKIAVIGPAVVLIVTD